MQANIGESEILTIEKKFLSTKTIINRRETDISVRILCILQETNISQIAANVKKLIIT